VHDPARIISVAFALCGFAVSIIAGLAAGRAAFETLAYAMLALVVCRMVGGVVTSIGWSVVREHVDRFKAENPVPEALPIAPHVGMNVDKR
jgi:hypothetical protein